MAPLCNKMIPCTPLFKSNRNLFSSVKWWYSFSMYRSEIFHVAWWGLLHSLWKISWVYVIASRLCEHSNLVRFEKRAAKTLQHVYRYGDIGTLYDIITTYGWFFCYNWHELCANYKLLDCLAYIIYWSKTLFKYQTRMSSYPIPFYADMQRAVPWNSAAGTSSYRIMPSNTAIWNISIFRDTAWAELIYFPISAAMVSMMFHRLMWTNLFD